MPNRIIPARGPIDNPTVTIRIDGTDLGPTTGIISVVVSREFNKVPFARIKMRDGVPDDRGFPLSSGESFIPGNELEVLAGYGSNEETIFKGKITTHRLKADSNGSYLEVEAKDPVVAMTLVEKDRFFREETDSGAWETIIGEYPGLTPELSGGEVTYEELVQYRETDWDFLLTRAEFNGKLVWVDDGTVNVTAPEAADEPLLEMNYGTNLIEIDVEADATALTASVKATAWNPENQEQDEAEASAPTFTPPGDFDTDELSTALDQPDEVISLNDPVSTESLQTLADSRLLRQHMAFIRGSMTCLGFDTVKPGSWLTLSGMGTRFDGDVYVTAVRHEISAGRWLARIQFGLDAKWFVERIGGGKKMAQTPRLEASQGLVIGVVTSLADPEGAGRIQVKLSSVDPDGEGLWARMGTFAAGADHGAFFQPEIEDEVVLGFLNGDPTYPVILGSLYNGTNPPALEAADENPEHQILTKSGLKLYFNDDDEKVSLETPGGQHLTLSDSDGEIILEDSNGNSIKLSSDGIALTSGKDLILEASGDVNISGVNVNGSAQAQLKMEGSAGIEVSSSAVATVKGSLVQIN